MEESVLCEVSSLQLALFLMFCAYYVFNFEYPKKALEIFYFLQDYILSYPDSYISVDSDIKHWVDID